MLPAAYEDIEGSPGVAMASSTPISFDKLTGSASWGKNKRAAITSVATSLCVLTYLEDEQEQRSSRSSQATYVSGVACARSQIGSCQVNVGDGMIEALESGVQRTGVPHELGQSHNCTCKPNKMKVNSVRKCFS